MSFSSLLSLARTTEWSKLLRVRKVKRHVWEELVSPHVIFRCVQTLLHAGFLDALREGPQSAEEYAANNDLNPELLRALCEALYARRILTQHGERFGLDETGRLIVTTNLGRGWMDLAHGYEPVLNNLEPLLRKQAAYGREVVRDGEFVGVGSGLASLDFYFPLVANFIVAAKRRKVLDIGCGDGAFLRYLCSTFPQLEGIGIDLSSAAVEAGRRMIVQERLENVRLFVGDAMEIKNLTNETAGVDCAATFFVLHELCDNRGNLRTLKFLQSFREALPGVPFHVIETIRPTAREMRERPGPAVEYFLFHDLSEQHPISRGEWRKLFQSSGFQSIQEDHMAIARTSIYTLA
ncbi:MAG TPA: methyltransferase domain-containing protein [Bryobacteraceae bacterium]|nr:methyltransferase domain-containing protein [Bryobacteraceae bacterium]